MKKLPEGHIRLLGIKKYILTNKKTLSKFAALKSNVRQEVVNK